MPEIDPTDGRLLWTGLAELERTGDGWVPRRLPTAMRDEISIGLDSTASVASGVRMTIMARQSDQLHLRLSNDHPTAHISVEQGADLTHHRVETLSNIHLPVVGDGPIDVWLPHQGTTTVHGVGLPDSLQGPPPSPTGMRWIAYGSSVTQSINGAAPALTATAIVARRNNLVLRNLGFANEAHLDFGVARFIAEKPADVITVCAGINVYLSASMSLRTFGGALSEFVRIIRVGHPDTPIILISPIFASGRERRPNYPRTLPVRARRLLAARPRFRAANALVGRTLEEFRADVAATARILQRSDGGISMIDGLDLLGPDDANLLADGLHPSAEGEEQLAERLGKHLRPILLG